MAQDIQLADFIADFKAELLEAMDRGKNDRLQLSVSDVDLELQFSVEKAKSGSGKLEFKVLGIGFGGGAERKATDKTAHTVKLSLQVLLDGKPYNPQIAGEKQQRPRG